MPLFVPPSTLRLIALNCSSTHQLNLAANKAQRSSLAFQQLLRAAQSWSQCVQCIQIFLTDLTEKRGIWFKVVISNPIKSEFSFKHEIFCSHLADKEGVWIVPTAGWALHRIPLKTVLNSWHQDLENSFLFFYQKLSLKRHLTTRSLMTCFQSPHH